MQSVTKIKLPQTSVESLVQHHLGPDVGLLAMQELDEGFFNTAYRLDLEDGRSWVLKVAPPADVTVLDYEEDIMTVEVDVMRLLRERTSLPVPAIHWHDTSGAVVDHPFYLMDHLSGTPLHQVRKELSADEQFKVDRQLGGYIREVNDIAGESFGYYASCQPRFERWPTAFDWMVRRLLDNGRARNVELPLPYDEVYARIASQFPLLDEVTTPSLVLWDVWDGNVFVDWETCVITGIIDYERALWADPLMEMSFGWYDPDGGFAQGYAKPMLRTPAERTRRTLYDIYLFLIMVIETYYRHYPDNGQETWARQKLSEALDKLSA